MNQGRSHSATGPGEGQARKASIPVTVQAGGTVVARTWAGGQVHGPRRRSQDGLWLVPDVSRVTFCHSRQMAAQVRGVGPSILDLTGLAPPPPTHPAPRTLRSRPLASRPLRIADATARGRSWPLGPLRPLARSKRGQAQPTPPSTRRAPHPRIGNLCGQRMEQLPGTLRRPVEPKAKHSRNSHRDQESNLPEGSHPPATADPSRNRRSYPSRLVLSVTAGPSCHGWPKLSRLAQAASADPRHSRLKSRSQAARGCVSARRR